MKLINKWRKERSTDDGCTVYQCLRCHTKWESRTPPHSPNWKTGHVYCGYCGVQWDGELSWDEDIVYPDNTGWTVHSMWIIEKKTFIKDKKEDVWCSFEDWNRIIVHLNVSARKVLDSLKYWRENEAHYSQIEWARTEVRCRMISCNSPEFEKIKGCGSYGHPDPDYYQKYQEKYGGKMHHSKSQRRWYRKDKVFT